MKCAVWNCANDSKNNHLKLSFFSFPEEKHLAKKWLAFCRQNESFNTGSWQICMEHFKAEDILDDSQFQMGLAAERQLKSDAVPCINKNSASTLPPTPLRLKRPQRRNRKKKVASLLQETKATEVDVVDTVVYENEETKFTVSEVHIKQETPDEELGYPGIVTAKISGSTEQQDQTGGENCNLYMREPKMEVISDDDIGIDETDCGMEGDNFYEDLFIGKEELQEQMCSDNDEPEYDEDEHLCREKEERQELASNYSELTDGNSNGDPSSSDNDCKSNQYPIRKRVKVPDATHFRNRVLLCPFCGIEFPNSFEWSKHLKDIHDFYNRDNLNMIFVNENTAKCMQCAASVSAKKIYYLQCHKITHLPYKQYFKCKLCKRSFTSGVSHKRHFEQFHDIIEDEKSKESANTTWQTNTILICPFCGIEFPGFYDWRQHLNADHKFNKRETLNMDYGGVNAAQCKQCHVKVSTKWTRTLQQHRILHLPFRRYFKCKLCHHCSANCESHKKHFHEHIHPVAAAHVKQEDSNSANTWEAFTTFLCPFCGTELSNLSKWRDHLNVSHDFNKCESLNMDYVDGSRVKCKQCNVELNSKSISVLEQHKISHLPYNQYFKCKLCGTSFLHLDALTHHLKKQHNYLVPDEIYEQLGVTAPENSPNNPVLLCPFCGTEFSNFSEWREHLNSIHKFKNKELLNMDYIDEYMAKCNECQLLVIDKLSSLQLHRITHLPYKAYVKCKLCTRCFTCNESHKRHFRQIHNRVPTQLGTKKCSENVSLLCPFCGTEFSNSFEWRQHLKDVHEFDKRESLNMEYVNENKVKCKECGTGLCPNSICTLQQHKITHLPFNRYFKCKLCEKTFLRMHPLTHHLQHQHNNRDPNESYKKHVSSAAESSPNNPIFICPYCGIEFLHSIEWRKHLKDSHEFHKRENLNMEYLHANRVKCKECSAEVSSRNTWSLQSHKITHLPYNRYVKCKLCNKLFSCVELQKRHITRSHDPNGGT